ncbi:hypothetical protein HELRODRAFT_161174 [Helobdella robusta]|uniref:SRCR domain-containing protein n=1 Tax=Helobdella robusta TaxID=6412 RepID=T1ER68_HELRO|nr:hypothetical protein HELRODRAFT_161174 [Helobdella robusta]ESO01964.1 hypothetical protein HELRODRAFT_161174 [Helobdella robusta]
MIYATQSLLLGRIAADFIRLWNGNMFLDEKTGYFRHLDSLFTKKPLATHGFLQTLIRSGLFSSHWSQICADDWGANVTHLVCTHLGFSTGTAYHMTWTVETNDADMKTVTPLKNCPMGLSMKECFAQSAEIYCNSQKLIYIICYNFKYEEDIEPVKNNVSKLASGEEFSPKYYKVAETSVYSNYAPLATYYIENSSENEFVEMPFSEKIWTPQQSTALCRGLGFDGGQTVPSSLQYSLFSYDEVNHDRTAYRKISCQSYDVNLKKCENFTFKNDFVAVDCYTKILYRITELINDFDMEFILQSHKAFLLTVFFEIDTLDYMELEIDFSRGVAASNIMKPNSSFFSIRFSEFSTTFCNNTFSVTPYAECVRSNKNFFQNETLFNKKDKIKLKLSKCDKFKIDFIVNICDENAQMKYFPESIYYGKIKESNFFKQSIHIKINSPYLRLSSIKRFLKSSTGISLLTVISSFIFIISFICFSLRKKICKCLGKHNLSSKESINDVYLEVPGNTMTIADYKRATYISDLMYFGENSSLQTNSSFLAFDYHSSAANRTMFSLPDITRLPLSRFTNLLTTANSYFNILKSSRPTDDAKISSKPDGILKHGKNKSEASHFESTSYDDFKTVQDNVSLEQSKFKFSKFFTFFQKNKNKNLSVSQTKKTNSKLSFHQKYYSLHISKEPRMKVTGFEISKKETPAKSKPFEKFSKKPMNNEAPTSSIYKSGENPSS